ncbi:uncharacterized protein LOC124161446 [Ischnura elegans]|uniref:uncharacterized protein LOC124161446 n=1 Tax=Ischnura elegans TaxID=197161 RepID=UPI001ED8A963|nr:uncharacterized protein LOC124161446 [Ischnura elegans]
MVVCSKHFLRSDYILPDVPAKQRHLKKSAIPSLNLPIGSTHDLTVKKPSRQRPLQSLKTLVEHHDIGCGGDVEGETEEHPVISPEEHEAAQVLVSLGETFPAVKASIEVQATPETREFGCQVSKSNRSSFSNQEKVVMTLMKLKLNWSYAVLSVLFGCTATTCIPFQFIILCSFDHYTESTLEQSFLGAFHSEPNPSFWSHLTSPTSSGTYVPPEYFLSN